MRCSHLQGVEGVVRGKMLLVVDQDLADEYGL
jgi:hypothetical protein